MRGNPARTHRNQVGLNELDYDSVVFRFQDCGRLEEITMQAPVVHIGNLSVPFTALASFVRTTDPSAFGKAGFLISPSLGLPSMQTNLTGSPHLPLAASTRGARYEGGDGLSAVSHRPALDAFWIVRAAAGSGSPTRILPTSAIGGGQKQPVATDGKSRLRVRLRSRLRGSQSRLPRQGAHSQPDAVSP